MPYASTSSVAKINRFSNNYSNIHTHIYYDVLQNMEDLVSKSPDHIKSKLDLMCKLYFNCVGNNLIPYYFDHKLASPVSAPSLILGCGIVISPSELFPGFFDYEEDEILFTSDVVNKIKIRGSLLNNCSGLNESRIKQIKQLIIDLYQDHSDNEDSFQIGGNKYDSDKHENICVMCPKPVYKLKKNESVFFLNVLKHPLICV